MVDFDWSFWEIVLLYFKLIFFESPVGIIIVIIFVIIFIMFIVDKIKRKRTKKKQ